MKKKIILCLFLIMLVSIIGCGVDSEDEMLNRRHSFNAKIVEITEYGFKVKAQETDSTGVPKEEQFDIDKEFLDKDMTVNDSVVVIFDGWILETDPPKLGKVYSVSKIVK